MARDQGFKVRENRARRAAARQGLELWKNPRRDPRALDYGSYVLVRTFNGKLVADFGWEHPGDPEGADWLADVEAYLDRGPHQRSEGTSR